MFQTDGQHNPAAYFNIYKVSLTRQQQKALSMLLPTKFSFQPYKSTRSLDEESLKSEPKHIKKKPITTLMKQAKDPDFSVSHIPSNTVPKEPKHVKNQSIQVIPGGEPFEQCYQILKKLKKSLYSWPFKQPVDPKLLGIPEYFNIVLEPIDLKTIEQLIKKEGYKHPSQFHRDIYKMMMNSYKFNHKNTDVCQATKEFQEEYLKIVKEVKDASNEKKIKIQEYSIQEGVSLRQKTSQELPSQSIKAIAKQYTKKQNLQDGLQNKSLEKIMIKQRQVKQKYKQKEQNQKIKIQNQSEKYKNIFQDNFISSQGALNSYQSQEPKAQLKSQFSPDDYLQLKQSKAESKLYKDDYEASISNQPTKKNINKMRDSKIKEKKPKKIVEHLQESPSQLKELKENNLVESEKSFYFNQVKTKLTDLLKKLNDYQVPNKIKTKAVTKAEGFQQTNFNNFVSVTAAEKKKLAEKISILPPSELRYVIQICFRNKRSKMRDQEGFYQIDLQKLDPKTLKEISNFVSMRIKKSKKESQRHIREERANLQQQIVEEAYNQIDDYIQDQDQEEEEENAQQQRNSINEHMYQNLLENEVQELNGYYPPQDQQYREFQMIDSGMNEQRNEYSQEFNF